MFNLNKQKNYKYSMATGPRAMMPGNFAAGARKFRLVEINEETTPRIAKIRDDINKTYSDDDGQLYFLFAAENKYSEPMDVNDDRVLSQMELEKNARESFVDSIILRDINDMREEELDLIAKDIIPQIANYKSTQIGALDVEPEKREFRTKNYIRIMKDSPLNVIIEDERKPSNEYIFKPIFTNKIEEAHPSRFSIDRAKLSKLGYNAPAMTSIDVFRIYNLYTKSANYHPEVSNKGEIQMLEESIDKLKKSKNNGYEKYDVNGYIETKINEIDDEKERKNLNWAWTVVKKLKLPLQYPSWVAIGWPQLGGDRLNLRGFNHGDNKEIDNLSELTFYNSETGRKMTWIGGGMKESNSGTKLPVTPHTTLIETIGLKQSTGKNKSIEYLRKKLSGFMQIVKISKGKKRESSFKKAKHTRAVLNLFEDIRDNMNSFSHTDVNSFFYLYDELCHLYFQYNRERYGDGIMLRFSAFSTDDNGGRTISINPNGIKGQSNRPFIPTTLHDDLREVIISVHYAYGTEIPQLAATAFSGNTSFLLDVNIFNRLIEKAKERGIKKLTVDKGQISEKTIPTEELSDFFNRMAKGGVLVYRINTNLKDSDNANIVWYTGMRSFSDRYDEKSIVTRMVHDGDKLVPITGYGKSRISSGTAAISNEFREELAKMQSYGKDEAVLGIKGWEDIFVGNNLMDVYRYANAKYGLDYDFDSIEQMASKKIKSISPDIIKEMTTSSEIGIRQEIIDKENDKRNPSIIITENTQELVKEIVTEIANEDLRQKNSNTPIIEEVQSKETDIITTPSVTPQASQQTEEDIQLAQSYQFANNVAGGIAVNEEQLKDLQSKGYILEPNGPLYKIVQFPSWVNTAY